MSQTLTTMIDPFDKSHHACTLSQMLKRSLELGPKYYCWDLPRYFVERGRLGLSVLDPGVFINPVRETCRRVHHEFELPPSLPESLRLLGTAGVRLTIPPRRLEGLVGGWWATRNTPGDVIECGSFRGADRPVAQSPGQARREAKQRALARYV